MSIISYRVFCRFFSSSNERETIKNKMFQNICTHVCFFRAEERGPNVAIKSNLLGNGMSPFSYKKSPILLFFT